MGAQLNIVLESPVRLDQAKRLDLWKNAVRLGRSDDPEQQRDVLRFFAAEALAATWPPIRIVVNHEDLGRLRVGIEAQPFQFALQVFEVVGALRVKAGRSRQVRGKTLSTLIAFFACVADVFIRRGGSDVQAVRAAAAKKGYVSRLDHLGELQLIYLLVEQGLGRRWGISLRDIQEDYVDFAKKYLYPHRAALSASAADVAANRLLMREFFGFEDPA